MHKCNVKRTFCWTLIYCALRVVHTLCALMRTLLCSLMCTSRSPLMCTQCVLRCTHKCTISKLSTSSELSSSCLYIDAAHWTTSEIFADKDGFGILYGIYLFDVLLYRLAKIIFCFVNTKVKFAVNTHNSFSIKGLAMILYSLYEILICCSWCAIRLLPQTNLSLLWGTWCCHFMVFRFKEVVSLICRKVSNW